MKLYTSLPVSNFIFLNPKSCKTFLIESPIRVNIFSLYLISPVAVASENNVKISSAWTLSGFLEYNSTLLLKFESAISFKFNLEISSPKALPKLIAVSGFSFSVLNNNPCSSSWEATFTASVFFCYFFIYKNLFSISRNKTIRLNSFFYYIFRKIVFN